MCGSGLLQFNTMEEEDIDMDTVHDSQAFIHHHLNLLERPSTPGEPTLIILNQCTKILHYHT